MADEVRIGQHGPLTEREAEAVLWVAQGKTSWEAGRILGVSEHTLSTHIANAAGKLAASNRAHLVTRAFVVGVLVVARDRACALLITALCALGADETVARRSPRPPRGREDGAPAAVASA